MLPIYGADSMSKTINVVLRESIGRLPFPMSIHTLRRNTRTRHIRQGEIHHDQQLMDHA
jgi:hypothetical protein